MQGEEEYFIDYYIGIIKSDTNRDVAGIGGSLRVVCLSVNDQKLLKIKSVLVTGKAIRWRVEDQWEA